ncbi:MAG: hAT transposon family protein [Gammaproteobacteria bacterium]|nr:hAT transposon family protein [Gammaproteobacteria bacterium]
MSVTNHNPLDFWKGNEAKFPILARIAKKYLSAVPSSVPSERTFSKASLIYTSNRKRLHDDKADKLITIKSNLEKLNFNYILLIFD